VAALLGGLHGRHDEVGAHAVRDVGLRPVDHIAAVHPAGEGADAGHVGARAGLGDPERRDALAADGGREEALLLVIRPELPDRRSGNADVGADARREAARTATPELL
jgi:hypothetical protein